MFPYYTPTAQSATPPVSVSAAVDLSNEGEQMLEAVKKVYADMDTDLDRKLDEAVLLLRDNGFTVKTNTTRKRGLIYLIRKPILHGRYQYLLRTRRTSNRESEFDEDTEIAEIDMTNLKWEPIIEKEV